MIDKSSKVRAKRACAKSAEGEEESSSKRRLMSADEFCFSLEDLNRQLNSKHNNDDSKENHESPDELDFCFWCDAKRFQANFKCPYHANGTKAPPPPPNTTSQDQPTKPPYAHQGIPEILKLFRTSTEGGEKFGVKTVKSLPAGAWIGPYEGKLVKLDDGIPAKKNEYMWEIFKDGKLCGYVDGSDENIASWMRFIRCARHKQEQNLHAFQYMNKIYYRTYKTIEPGQELLVWYDETYTQYQRIPGNDFSNMKMGFPKKGDSLVPKTNYFQYTPAPKETSERVEHRRSLSSEPETTLSPTASSSLSSVATNGSLQMQTSFQRIGALMESPTKSKGHATNDQVSTGQQETPTNFPITRPKALSSDGFSLIITNGHVTNLPRSTPVSDTSASPGAAVVPSPDSPISPSTPSSNDSGFSFEVTSDENSNKSEPNESSSLWKCGQCRKTFAQRAMLQVHVCTEVPFRPYKCGHCDESFSTSGEMRTHAVIHQRRKPFKCGYCSRSFSGATTLNNHIRIHTGEKPFKCEKCDKTFSQGSQLSKHEKIPGDCLAK